MPALRELVLTDLEEGARGSAYAFDRAIAVKVTACRTATRIADAVAPGSVNRMAFDGDVASID